MAKFGYSPSEFLGMANYKLGKKLDLPFCGFVMECTKPPLRHAER